MASRKKNQGSDDNKGSPSAQQALEDYLDLMLGVVPARVDAVPVRVDQESPQKEVSPQDVPIAPPSPFALLSSVTPIANATTAAFGVQPDDKLQRIDNIQPSANAQLDADASRDTKAQDSAQSNSQNKTQAKPTMLAESAALQQKLVQARVKDLTEKSLQNIDAQARQAAHADADRRERLAAARELVKQRIAARAVPIEKVAPPPEPVQQPPEPVQKKAETKIEPAAVIAVPVEQTGLPPAPQWLENGRPVWAQSAFECLLFSVSGLVLAVPLIELGSIYPLREHLTPIVGQIDWFLGLMHVEGRKNVRTVNTAKIVMPEKYDPAFVEQIRYVISINGHDWGLAVDKIDKAVTLKPDDVRWRSERSRRPWLAGTVVDYMCALVDVQELALMLSLSDHSRPDHSRPSVRH